MVADFDVFNQPIEAKRRTGYLPETPPLYPDMTTREYLDFVAQDQGRARRANGSSVSQPSWSARASPTWPNRHCGKLSKGYRQRVGLAQALIHNPEVLILDEPTAGLDPKQIIETRDLIRSLAGDHTIVLSTHILPEVAQTCQRVVIINKGRVVAVDTPDNLTARLKGAATMYVQVDAPGADAGAALAAVRGVTRVASADQPRASRRRPMPLPPSTGPLAFEVESEPDVDVRRDLARAVVTRGWGLLELRPVRMSLEDVFLQVITEEVPEEAPACVMFWR